MPGDGGPGPPDGWAGRRMGKGEQFDLATVGQAEINFQDFRGAR